MRHSVECILLLCALIPSGHSVDSAPYGHHDFYPSEEQPAQLRGDGSGYFPGAKAVDSFDFRTKENIIWACPLPGWGFSSPIVVGDKAFVTCDWNKLVCIDVRTGTVLWAKDNHTFETVGGDKAAHLAKTFDQITGQWLRAHQIYLEHGYIKREIELIEGARNDLSPSAYEKMNWGKHVPNDHLTKAEVTKILAQAKSVDDATLQKLKDRRAALDKIVADEELEPGTDGYRKTLSPHNPRSQRNKAFSEHKLANGLSTAEAMKTLAKHGIVFEIWNGWLGRSFSTPASDGTHVYAQFGQSQVVCYDLAGNRKWITALTIEGSDKSVNPGARRQNDSASLILADDKVIVLMGGKDTSGTSFIQALDKKTGAMLWQTPLSYIRAAHSFPNQTRVKHGSIDAIATSAGAIVRTSDGSIIMKDLPAPIAPPLVVNNDVYLMCGAGESNGAATRMKITLSSQGDDIVGTINWAFIPQGKGGKIVKLKAWKSAAEQHTPGLTSGVVAKKDPYSDVGALLVDGMVCISSGAYDAETGGVKKAFRLRPKATGHLIRTGNDLIFATAQNRDTYVYDAKKFGPPKSFDLGSEWHRRIQLGETTLEEAIKNVAKFPWLPHTVKHFGGQTTAWPQGNRLYIRTHDTLYCIGDPKAPYHSPALTPAAAKTGH